MDGELDLTGAVGLPNEYAEVREGKVFESILKGVIIITDREVRIRRKDRTWGG